MPELPHHEDDVDDGNLPWSAYVFAVWNLIIRPPRQRYSRYELMAEYPYEKFKVGNQHVRRLNFSLTNPRGHTLVCTLFEPFTPKAARKEGEEENAERACVVFCHGNGGSRLNGFHLVKLICPLNIALVCFDFAGSGMSDGEYVSLGFYERDDLGCVVDHLRGARGFSRIGVWGVSMGAVTAIMHAARDPSIAGLVADSPFSDLWGLIEEICARVMHLPPLVVRPLLQMIRLVIKQKALFDICEVSPQAHVGGCFVPALFIHGDQDDFVVPSHSETLRKRYKGEAQRLAISDGTHHSRRPDAYMSRAAVFLVRALRWEHNIPSGITEEMLAGNCREPPPPQKCLIAPDRRESDEVKRLLAQPEPAIHGYGLVRAACELCGAYRGAEFVCISSPGGDPNAAGIHLVARQPASLSGQVSFFGDNAEAAMCWVEEPRPGACGGGRVWFSMLSPTQLSLTVVKLAKSSASDKVAGNSFAGLTCVAVEPVDLCSASLGPGKSHDLALSLGGNGSRGPELEAGGNCVAAAGAESAGDPQPDAAAPPVPSEVHVWCVQWRHSKDGGGVRLALEAVTARPAESPGGAAAEEQRAEAQDTAEAPGARLRRPSRKGNKSEVSRTARGWRSPRVGRRGSGSKDSALRGAAAADPNDRPSDLQAPEDAAQLAEGLATLAFGKSQTPRSATSPAAAARLRWRSNLLSMEA